MKMHTIFALFDKADEVRITRDGSKVESVVSHWGVDDGADYGMGDAPVILVSTDDGQFALLADQLVELGPQGAVVGLRVREMLVDPRNTVINLAFFRKLWLKPADLPADPPADLAGLPAWIEQNLQTMAAEIVDWRRTGLLCNGLLRELARSISTTQDDHLAMAESAVITAALRRLASSSSTSSSSTSSSTSSN